MLAFHFNNQCVDCMSWDGTYPHNFYDDNEINKITIISN